METKIKKLTTALNIEVLADYGIQLFRYFFKRLIQVERFNAYPVSAHHIRAVGLDILIGRGIQKHTRNAVLFIAELGIFVLHISEYLILIAGMQSVNIILHLRGVSIIFGINDKNLVVLCQRNIALHNWEHCTESIIQRPRNL